MFGIVTVYCNRFLLVQYEVVDLMELCDVNLHRAVTRDNVLDILTLAKLYRLNRTLAMMQSKLSK